MLILLNAPLMGPIISSPSFACHIVLMIGTFALFDQVIAHQRFSYKWFGFLSFSAFLIATNLGLFPESSAMIIPLFIVGFGVWDFRMIFSIGFGVLVIAAVGLISHLLVWMPRWHLFVWEWGRIVDDCRLVRSAAILFVVMFMAIPLKGSSVLKLSHRRLMTLLQISICVFALFPWVAGEQGTLLRFMAIQFVLILIAGIVFVRHQSLAVIHPLLLAAVGLSWIARYRFRPFQFDFYSE